MKYSFLMAKEEMVALARSYEAGQLLRVYEWMGKNFDPLEESFCDFYNVVKDEVLRRLERGKD